MRNSAADAVAGIIALIILAALVYFTTLVWWKIFSKTGNIGAISLLMLIPLFNIIPLIYLAFSEWPIHKELRELRRQVSRNPS
jgi:uncharacterized membrane protein